jgi:hypothetical protein
MALMLHVISYSVNQIVAYFLHQAIYIDIEDSINTDDIKHLKNIRYTALKGHIE